MLQQLRGAVRAAGRVEPQQQCRGGCHGLHHLARAGRERLGPAHQRLVRACARVAGGAAQRAPCHVASLTMLAVEGIEHVDQFRFGMLMPV